MSLELLRECVRAILTEKIKQEEPSEEIALTADDVLLGLDRELKSTNPYEVEVFAPYTVRRSMKPSRRRPELASVSPFAAVSTVKYGSKLSPAKGPDGSSKTVRLTITPEEASHVLDLMADGIARRFEGDEFIKLVTCVDSQHPMARELAERVAARLNVPYQPVVKKTMDPLLSWDEAEWQAYADQVRATGLNGRGDPLAIKGRLASPDEYLAHALKVLENEREAGRALVRRGEKPSIARMMSPKSGHKRFFNLFDKVAAEGVPAGGRILAVDDNVDSGWTPKHVSQRIREAGYRPLFAVGFRML